MLFRGSRIAFVNSYQPTTSAQGTPQQQLVAWRRKQLAAEVRRGALWMGLTDKTANRESSNAQPACWPLQTMCSRHTLQALGIVMLDLRLQEFTVILGMDANTDLLSKFPSGGGPGALLQQAFAQLQLLSAWGADDQATRGRRMLDYIFSSLAAEASGCAQPQELGLKSDHSLVWAVYQLVKAASKRQRAC